MPELRRYQIVSNGRAHYAVGYIYGDQSIEDGTHIRTSRLLQWPIEGGRIHTALRTYRLVDPA